MQHKITMTRKATRSLAKTGLTALAALLVLAGCQTTRVADSEQSRQSHSIDGELSLKQTIDVRRHYARSIIQDGAVVNKPDLYTPWCTVHVYRSRVDIANATQIESDTFSIRRVYNFIDYAALPASQSYLVADNGPIRIHEEPSNVTFSTVFELSSQEQPNVTKMVCSIFDDPRWGESPSLSDVAATLGELAQLKL